LWRKGDRHCQFLREREYCDVEGFGFIDQIGVGPVPADDAFGPGPLGLPR
jgi:hypothetical protein